MELKHQKQLDAYHHHNMHQQHTTLRSSDTTNTTGCGLKLTIININNNN
jgi:hypothetical protein